MTLPPSSAASLRSSASATAADPRRPIAFLLLACCLLGACQSSAPSKPADPVAPPDLSAYRLGIGDKVKVDVFNEPDLSISAEVDATGQINYPLLGAVPALKRTASELEASIAKGLANGYLVNPDVRVTLVQYRAFYVIGQVNHAGAYPYSAGLTVEKALALAGGMTRLASSRGIYLLHEDTPANKREQVGLGTAILPGDTIVVEESLF